MFFTKKWFVMLAIVMLLLPGPQRAFARGRPHPPILPPNSRPQGRTLGEWGAQLFQAVYETPASENPFVGGLGDHCAYQLDGHVALLWTNPFAGVPYSCSVPPGTVVITPFAGLFCDTDSWPFPTNEEELRQCVNDNYEITDLQGSFDGVALQTGLLDRYLVITPAASYKVPADNIWGWPEGTTGQLMAKIHFLMVAPMPVGEHTLHFHAYYPDFDLTEDFTLNLTVEP